VNNRNLAAKWVRCKSFGIAVVAAADYRQFWVAEKRTVTDRAIRKCLCRVSLVSPSTPSFLLTAPPARITDLPA